jgi:hypothetical protein
LQARISRVKKKEYDMAENEVKGKVMFTGFFNEEIREQMRVRRLERGLTLSEAAKQFQVDYSTYRKWEVGPTVHASPMYFPRIKAFLRDDDANGPEVGQNNRNVSANGVFISDQLKALMESAVSRLSSGKTLISDTLASEMLEVFGDDCRSECVLLDSLLLSLHQKLLRIMMPATVDDAAHQG